MKYTDDQRKVIELHNRNLLVAAAAGSGKTAVLVERIIRMISEEGGIDIDRLLVVTFTKAAAAEMRERIGNAVMKKLEDDPENEHLQRQSALLHHARICTIDSFCQDVLRNNFEKIGLDPAFRVADENEVRLILEDTLSEIIEERFGENNEDFIHLVKSYSSKGTGIEQTVFRLLNFALSHPYPEKWLNMCLENYMADSKEEFDNLAFVKDYADDMKLVLNSCLGKARRAVEICYIQDGPLEYATRIETDISFLESILEKEDYDDFAETLLLFDKGTLDRVKNKNVDKSLKDGVSSIRKKYLSEIDKIKECLMKSDEFILLCRECRGSIQELVNITLELMKRSADKKKELGIVDFSDMEHMALNLFIEERDGKYYPSDIAVEYRKCFAEIMIDEYQDSNYVQEYLLSAISGEDEGNFNRFMVGDVKQSIYRFRQARPDLFLKKYRDYTEEDSTRQKIDLHMNFRSRKEVLFFVNEVFSKVMMSKVGGIDYDDKAALYHGATYYPETDNDDYISEMHIIRPEKNENGKAVRVKAAKQRELEARLVAMKIKDMVGKFNVSSKEKDPETGEEKMVFRKAKYSDIVILLRARGEFDLFKNELEKCDIPVCVSSKEGYFRAEEVCTMLSFLQVIDNPLLDIPLFGILVSPIGDFTEREAAELKLAGQRTLYENLALYAKSGKDEFARKKAGKLIEMIERYRDMLTYTPVHELISYVIEDSGYNLYVLSKSGGEVRKANLDFLIEQAKNYEKTSFSGIFHFVRYIEKLKKYSIDMGEADITDENENVVRIMTIHGSKGLEFPICFVSLLGKNLRKNEGMGAISLNSELGVGIDFVQKSRKLKVPNPFRTYLEKANLKESMGEELRILYVALTRAKEKLILTGYYDDSETEENYFFDSTEVMPEDVLEAASYMDIISLALGGMDKRSYRLHHYTEKDITPFSDSGKEHVDKRARFLMTEPSEEVLGILKERLSREYSHKELTGLIAKTSVSELKIAALVEEGEAVDTLFPETERKEYIPGFVKKREKGGTERGNAYHKVMELLSLANKDKDSITRELDALVEGGRLSEEYRSYVNLSKLLFFLSTESAQRMKRAGENGRLFREQPFVLGIEANRTGIAVPPSETVLVQGIIDAFWEEEDGIVLLDYKTDAVKEEGELIERYRTQFDYYTEALEKIRNKRVKERIIYSFALGREIRL